MGYHTFSTLGKNLTKSEDIGAGQIETRHLSPSLYTELRKVPLHTHSGLGSRQINLAALTGSFSYKGFLIYSPNGKLWQITASNTGVLESAEIT